MIVLSEEQTMLRDMAQSWATDRAPVASLRSLRDTHAENGFDPALYSEMAEMGWTGIIAPEELGGVGLGLVSLGLIAEELGRQLVGSPLLPTAAGAVSAVLLGGNEGAAEEWLPGLIDGSTVAAVALDEASPKPEAVFSSKARPSNGGWVLEGSKPGVAEGAAADLIVVAASLPDGTPALLACPADAEGLSRTKLVRIDSRGAANLDFADVHLSSSALLGSGADYCEAVFDRCRAVLAAEMLGGSLQAYETTLDYLKTRVQFDRPIGSFQALQHRAAEMLGEIVLTRAAVYAALRAIDENAPDCRQLVSVAKAMAGDCFRAVAREMIQMHGGIGMTDEHDAGLYLKRAMVANSTWGTAAFHRERYARLLNI